jgi:hypothetical protein
MLIAALLALQTPPPDLVVMNARIWSDGRVVRGDCLAIRDGRFVYVGPFRPEMARSGTRVVDARGQMVIPGLIDSHTHLLEGGVGLFELQLRPATSKADFIRRVKEWNEKLPPGQWLTGNGWSAESWPEKEQPTKEWIDAVTGDRPAFLTRMDGHSALANSAALRKAGITKDGPKDPPGGVIDRDANGEPTGMLREEAVGLVQPPPPTEEERYRGLLAAVKEANRYGVTTVSDIASVANFDLYRRYASQAEPTLRFALYARTDDWNRTITAVNAFKNVPGWAEARGLKAFMDGSLGSRTAFMHAPFNELPPGKPKDWRGVPMPGAVDGTYRQGFRAAAAAGLQVIVHAIGDQANHDLLNLYENIPDLKARRFRVEHVQHLMPGDIPRFARLGVIPSLQPYHKADDGRYCEAVIGADRSRHSYAFRSLLAANASMVFGSDWDVVTIDPFAGINTAVTGKILTGKVWQPQQNITLDQALSCYTSNGAYAAFWENEIGRIAPGFRADFVVLNQRTPTARTLDRLAPSEVYVEGRKVYGQN